MGPDCDRHPAQDLREDKDHGPWLPRPLALDHGTALADSKLPFQAHSGSLPDVLGNHSTMAVADVAVFPATTVLCNRMPSQ